MLLFQVQEPLRSDRIAVYETMAWGSCLFASLAECVLARGVCSGTGQPTTAAMPIGDLQTPVVALYKPTVHLEFETNRNPLHVWLAGIVKSNERVVSLTVTIAVNGRTTTP